MSLTRQHLLNTTFIAGLAVLASAALPVAASAQTTTDQPPGAPLNTTADDPQSPAHNDVAVEEVVVTGSRIRRSEFNSPDPVQVITAETGRVRGITDAGALLRSSTVASGSPQITTAVSSAFVTEGGPGSQTISLRGLGANRTLVLLNGRRAGPAGTRGGVSAFDLNVIPTSIIDRVEILKDGASSIYGSDAVAGVVNIITKRDTDGLQLHAFTQQPQKQGGAEYQGDITWGKTFSRGYFTATYSYYKQAMQRIGNRRYTNCEEQYRFTQANQRADIIDPRTGRPQCRNLAYDQIWVYGDDFSGRDGLIQYDYNGTLGNFIPQLPPGQEADYPGLPAGYYVVGYDDPSNSVMDMNSPFNLKSSLTPRLERNTVYAEAGFDITDHMQAYSEVLLNRRVSKSDGFRQIWTYVYEDQFAGTGFSGPFILSPTIASDLADSKEQVDYGRALVGLKGDFGGFLSGWNYDVYGQFSHSKGKYGQHFILDDTLNAQQYGYCTGAAGEVTPVSNRPCVGIDWLSPQVLAGQLSPEQTAFLSTWDTGKTIYKQSTIEGSVSGDLFRLPAGPVGAAFGAVYRHDSITDTPSQTVLDGLAWNSSAAGITKGSDSTKELYGELSVPVLRDLPFIDSFNLSLSGRYTDVSSYGSDQTYKVGANWQVTPWLRLRATQGTSFRAPALYELYLANETGFLSQRSVDPCIRWAQNLSQGNIPQRVADNCAASGIAGTYTGAGAGVTVTSGGGYGTLEAETSKARTVGIILTPKFADLSIAVDYFDIKVKNEVTQLGANNIVYQCYNSQFFPTDPLCSLFQRNATGLITDVTDNFLNIASQVNRGVDLTVRYSRDMPFDSHLTVDFQSTWQVEDKTALFADTIIDRNGRVGDPDWTGQLNFQLTKGDWTLFYGIDAFGKTSDAEDISDVSSDGQFKYKVNTEFTAYHSMSIQRTFGEDLTALVGIANIFNETPPAVSSNVGVGQTGNVGRSVLASQYDYVGRRFFIDLRKTF